MSPFVTKSSTIFRLCPRHRLHVLPSALIKPHQRRCKADAVDAASDEYSQTPRFQSPFKGDSNPTTKIPSFANYMSKRGETTNKTFQYFMVGTMGLLAAAGAQATVFGELDVRKKRKHCYTVPQARMIDSAKILWASSFSSTRRKLTHCRRLRFS